MALIGRPASTNRQFKVVYDDTKNEWSLSTMQVVILMDIRDELQKLNQLLHCTNFVNTPKTLKAISRKLTPRVRLSKGQQ